MRRPPPLIASSVNRSGSIFMSSHSMYCGQVVGAHVVGVGPPRGCRPAWWSNGTTHVLGDRDGVGHGDLLLGDVALLLHGDEGGVAAAGGLLGGAWSARPRSGPDEPGQQRRLRGP